MFVWQRYKWSFLFDILDIAESDLIYTETLMGRGVENYEGKEICILGGGDGALLYELLKEKPKFVVMLEIDELVMQACNKYLNSICGDVLEKRKGDNYEIIVGDCVEYMKKFIADGRKFDYVFGDLTDIPISGAPIGECWDFIRTILEHSFKILKPDGKYLTHGNGTSCVESLELFEEQLGLLKPKVKFTTSKAFVPSFMEEWLFYQVSLAWRGEVEENTYLNDSQRRLNSINNNKQDTEASFITNPSIQHRAPASILPLASLPFENDCEMPPHKHRRFLYHTSIS